MTSTDINTLNTFNTKFDISKFKDEELYYYIEPRIEHSMHNDCAINIEWDERLNLQENKKRKKKIKEKLLMANKGKFIVDYKKIWNQDPGGALTKIIYGDLHPRKWKNPKSIKLFCLLPKNIIIFDKENPEISQNCQKTKVIY